MEPKTQSVHVEKTGEADGTTANVKEMQVMSAGLKDALAKDNIPPLSWCHIKLYLIMILTTLNCCMNGYDGSLMSALNAMDPFHHHFGIPMQGSQTGLVFAIYAAGNLVGAAVAALAADTFGRRFGMSLGSLIIIVGAILEASAPNVDQFIGGRFLIGFGISVCNTAAPVYLVEMIFPQWRGTFGGLYNVVGYYVGALACTWISYGTGYLTTNWCWRIPTIIQAVPSLIVMCCAWLMPESPRWLFANNKQEQAKKILIQYHGMGNPDSALVAYEINEIEQGIQFDIETDVRRWWNYKVLFSTRDMLYRLWLLFLVSVFSLFIGGAVISYFMPVMLENAGITGSRQQLLLNALNIVFSFVSGIAGSFTVEKFGRRTLFLWGTFITGLIYIPINVIASFEPSKITVGMGYGFIACIFMYGIVFSFCWTTLQSLYPAEILPNRVRAKGMAFQTLLAGAANFINFYATPVALKRIGWRMYTIFLVLHGLEYVFMFLTLPETKGRTIEELEELFLAKNPVKASLKREHVVVKEGEGVKAAGVNEI